MEKFIKNLMFDLASDREIRVEDRIISKAEANDKIRQVCFEVLGLDENASDKQIKRALKSDKAAVLFEVIEEVIDQQIAYGWNDNEFFNNYVETRNQADGDRTDFWTDDEVLLNVARVSGDHHDLTIQRLGEGSSFTVPTSVYAVKVGGDIRLFLTGRKNWADLIDAVAKAFTKKIQEELFAEFMNASASLPLPSGFVGTGALSSSTKAQFDEIVENVAAVNESSVVIMGTKVALKNLNALAGNGSVNWIAESDKESVARTGILGDYEGTALLEIPQRFKDNTLASKLIANNVLLIFPLIDDFKPVKFVDGGETTLEVSEVGDTMDDRQTYEAQRRMGIGTIITRYFGKWTI